jgi:transposase InsO family protein
MELWQMGIMGGVSLTEGTELKVVTGIDDHSRFCVSAKVVRRATTNPVCDALAEAMRRHGGSRQRPPPVGRAPGDPYPNGMGEVV